MAAVSELKVTVSLNAGGLRKYWIAIAAILPDSRLSRWMIRKCVNISGVHDR